MVNRTDETLVTLDGRKRAALARIADHEHYLVRKQPDGTIIMEPAEVVSITSTVETMHSVAEGRRREQTGDW